MSEPAAVTSDIRRALLLSLPGVAVAALLRLWLLCYMPAAFVHDDTFHILQTPAALLEGEGFILHPKKTFLAPLLYSIPALLHIPILYFISVVQHLFGVLLVLLIGLLAYAWFTSWRLWIVPLTVLIAINPVLLWYEHTALPESLAVFGTVAVALTGTLYWKQPDRNTLALFFFALIFAAGARPEGRLLSLFAVALVTWRFWGNWPRFKIDVGLTVAWTFSIFMITRTAQSGLLLYASLIQWSPDHLLLAPGLAERMRPFQAEAISMWKGKAKPHLADLRRAMRDEVAEFLKEQGIGMKGNMQQEVNKFSSRAADEIAIRNVWRLPGFALKKFVIAHYELPSFDFTDYPIEGQFDVLYKKPDSTFAEDDGPMLWGVNLASRYEVRTFLSLRYDVVPGTVLTPFLAGFVKAGLSPIAPIDLPGAEVRMVKVEGLPWLYVCALIGAVCLVLRERPAFGFQFLWFLFFLAFFIGLMLTANIRARFRILFEPFWYVYLFALLDSLLAIFQRIQIPRQHWLERDSLR